MEESLKKEKWNSHIKNVRFVLFVLTLLLFLCLITISIAFRFHKSRIEHSWFERYHRKGVNEYQTLELDFSRSRATVGSLTSYQELGPEEVRAFKVEEKNSVILVSNFGTEEYECFGSCSCSVGERRSSTSSAVTRRLFFLVAASSAVLAHNIAKDRFTKYCESEENDFMSSSCPIDSIVSNVDFCEKVVESSNEEENQEEEGKSEGFAEDDFRHWRNSHKFWCKGHCAAKTEEEFDAIEYQLQYNENYNHRTKSLKTGGKLVDPLDKVDVDRYLQLKRYRDRCESIVLRKEVYILEKKYGYLDHYGHMTSIEQFAKEDLFPFCKEEADQSVCSTNAHVKYCRPMYGKKRPRLATPEELREYGEKWRGIHTLIPDSWDVSDKEGVWDVIEDCGDDFEIPPDVEVIKM